MWDNAREDEKGDGDGWMEDCWRGGAEVDAHRRRRCRQCSNSRKGGWVALSGFIGRILGGKRGRVRGVVYTTMKVADRPPLPPSDPLIA